VFTALFHVQIFAEYLFYILAAFRRRAKRFIEPMMVSGYEHMQACWQRPPRAPEAPAVTHGCCTKHEIQCSTYRPSADSRCRLIAGVAREQALTEASGHFIAASATVSPRSLAACSSSRHSCCRHQSSVGCTIASANSSSRICVSHCLFCSCTSKLTSQ
jgi:hypothetical protein